MIGEDVPTLSLSQVVAGRTAFQQSFCQHVANLFGLARILMGDEDAAISCLLKSIHSMDLGRETIPDLTRAWSRRAVISAATSLLSTEIAASAESTSKEGNLDCWEDLLLPQRSVLLFNEDELTCALTSLNVYLRFVWVLRFGETYTTAETASLLGIDLRLIQEGTALAAIALTSSLIQSKSGSSAH